MAVENHRVPLLVCETDNVLGLPYIAHVSIPIDAASCIFFFSSKVIDLPHRESNIWTVPLSQKLHPIGISKNKKKNHIVSDKAGRGIFCCHQVISELDLALGWSTFTGMNTALDIDRCLAFRSQPMGFLIGQVFNQGQLF